jgi:hypothetical protein
MQKTAQVPHPIVQAEIFLPTLTPVSPYERRWDNELGDKCYILAPRTPNHYDLVTLLGYLHVIQQYPVVVEDADEDRYRVTMPMSFLYQTLQCDTNVERISLWRSLELLAHTSYSVQYKNPANHGGVSDMVLAGLTGDLKLITQRGRKGNILIAKPLRGLVDDRMLTVDIARLITLKAPLARITAFFMQCREAKELTWEGWMRAVSGATYLKRFKAHFVKALKELESVGGYTVKIRGDNILIRRV